MFALHKLYYVTQVISMNIEMLLGTGQRQTARRVRSEVAEIPAFDEATESRDSRMLFQGA